MMDLKTYEGFNVKRKTGSDYENGLSRPFKPQKRRSLIHQIYLNGKTIMADEFHENNRSMAILMQILVNCCSNVNKERIDKKAEIDKALLDFAATKGFYKKLFDKIIPKIAEVSVDGTYSTSTIVGLNGQYRLMIKDQQERLLERCDKLLLPSKTIPLTVNAVTKMKNIYNQMICDNLEVVILAFKDLDVLPVKLDPVFQTDGLTLVGMVGLRDDFIHK